MVDAYVERRGMEFGIKWDWRQFNSAVDTMDRTASEVMADAIKDAMMEELGGVQGYIKQSSPVNHRYMANDVADSLIIEEGRSSDDTAMVRFGSDPIDNGGVTGSRGGKLAAILQYGMQPFGYPFTFKTIENSRSSPQSAGFINARLDKKVHPGIPAIGWLDVAEERVTENLMKTLEQRLHEAWS